MRDFEDVFTGLGCLPGEYYIEIDLDSRPVQHTPRLVQYQSKPSLRKRLMRQKILETKPTDRIRSLVAVQTPGKLRVCTDARDINPATKRLKYQMPIVNRFFQS